MKIAILSDSPTLITGFARTTRNLVFLLTKSGHEVHCFGIGAWGDIKKMSNLNYHLWMLGEHQEDHFYKLLKFVDEVKPEVILINYDLFTACSWLNFIRKSRIKCRLIVYAILDGLPIIHSALVELNSCSAVITPVRSASEFLKKHITTEIYTFPHLVDESIFFQDQTIKNLKLSINEKTTYIGIFSQNQPRKQIVQVIQALKILVDLHYNVRLLIHTDYKNSSWRNGYNLDYIVNFYELNENCIITETYFKTDEIHKVPFSFEGNTEFDLMHFLNNATIEQKINLSDIVIVPTAYGGFEYSIIESQACGVPVCSTVDGAILSEVAGGCTYPLVPEFHDFTSYGALSCRISPTAIAKAIEALITNEALKNDLISKGLINAKKYFLQENLEIQANLLNLILKPQ